MLRDATVVAEAEVPDLSWKTSLAAADRPGTVSVRPDVAESVAEALQSIGAASVAFEEVTLL